MQTTTPLLQRGICRPYPTANQPVLSGDTECCDDATTCMDSVTIADAAVVQGIVYVPACGPNAGVDVPITFPATATNATAVVLAVQNALLPYEFGVFVDSVDSAGNFILRHQGQGTLKSVTIGGSPTASTRLCTVRVRCEYTGQLNGTSTAIIVNGTSRAFATAVVYGTDSAAVAAGKIQTAVNLASLAGGATVTVTDDVVNLRYNVEISARQGTTFLIVVTSAADVELLESNCQQVFEA